MQCSLVLTVFLVGAAMAQYQSFYAGGGWQYPGPLPQFTNNNNNDDGLGSRAGERPGPTTTTTTLSPHDELVNRVGSWPKERQPFWILNREQLDQLIGRPQANAPSNAQRKA